MYMHRQPGEATSSHHALFATLCCQLCAVESFTATAEVRLFQWEFDPSGEKEWLQKRIVEAFTLHNVALEYGGDRRCGQQAQHGQQQVVTQGMGQPDRSRFVAGLLQSTTNRDGAVPEDQ